MNTANFVEKNTSAEACCQSCRRERVRDGGCAAETTCCRHKPNPKGIFVQCPYSDKRHFSSLKPPAPKNKPFQTEACCHFAPPTRGVLSILPPTQLPSPFAEGLGVRSAPPKRGVLSLRAADKRVGAAFAGIKKDAPKHVPAIISLF
jgi:hypothetical protein